MSTKQSNDAEASDSLYIRARNAGTAYAPTIQSAAQNAQAAAQTAAQGMGRSMRQGVYSARGWAAPRLESAADYYTETVTPHVADALRSTARQVRPEDTRRKPAMRSALSMSVLAIAVLAAAGALAALIRRQYKAAMEADTTEDDAVNVGDANEPTATTPASVPGQASAPSAATSANASRVGTDSGSATGQKPSSNW